MEFTSQFYDEGWEGGWDDMRLYGPTARHTRKFVLQLLQDLSFQTMLDAGCGTGVLLQAIHEKYPHVKLTGSEVSGHGLELARKRLPDSEFMAMDLSKQVLERKFDLITCIDVLEHILDDRAALSNLFAMSAGHLILSVPLGPLFPVEAERLGHVHGYSREELEGKICEAGFQIVRAFQWGFPFYNLHRRLANRMPKQATLGRYNPRKKLISKLIYALFYLNIAPGGERYYVLCRTPEPALES
jgi:SAM-dependent methyltransferase